MIVVNIFYIPFNIAFEVSLSLDQDEEIFFNAGPTFLLLLELLLNFNTAYYHKGIIHTSRQKILIHYVKGDFILDLVALLPFFLVQLRLPYLTVPLLLKVTRFLFCS